MQNEFLKINGIDVGFADHPTEDSGFLPGALDSQVAVRKGKIHINLLTPSFTLTPQMHQGLVLEEGSDKSVEIEYLRFATYYDLTVPEGTYGNTVTCPYGEINTGFEVYGYPLNARFYGQISVEEGVVHIKGELRDYHGNESPTLPIEIRKEFDPRPLLPPRTEYSLEQARNADPLEVYHLSIVSQTFEQFPEEILKYKNLEHLFFGANCSCQFDHLPDELFELGNLHTLEIHNSQIREISPRIGNLQKLEELSINMAGLTQLPDEIALLPELQTLSFNYNQLESLPENIGSMNRLKRLNITGNNFQSLPESVAKITHVSIDRKYKKLYTDDSYTSTNPNPIDNTLYGLDQNEAATQELAGLLDAEPHLHDLKEFIIDHAQIATRIVTSEYQDEVALGGSKLGGAPDLPGDWEHPHENGKHYVFHAQINCAEIAPYQKYLPRDGMLYFFVNDEEYVQKPIVLYTRDTSNLVRYVYDDDTEFIDYDFDGEVRSQAGVTFVNALSLPEMYDLDRNGPGRYQAYTEVFKSLEDDLSLETPRFELVGGIENTINQKHFSIDATDDFRTHAINTHVFSQHENAQEQAAARFGGEPEEWLVLLNLESIGEFSFWDAGTLTYCIHKKDLAINDFSKIVTSIESS